MIFRCRYLGGFAWYDVVPDSFAGTEHLQSAVWSVDPETSRELRFPRDAFVDAAGRALAPAFGDALDIMGRYYGVTEDARVEGSFIYVSIEQLRYESEGIS